MMKRDYKVIHENFKFLLRPNHHLLGTSLQPSASNFLDSNCKNESNARIKKLKSCVDLFNETVFHVGEFVLVSNGERDLIGKVIAFGDDSDVQSKKCTASVMIGCEEQKVPFSSIRKLPFTENKIAAEYCDEKIQKIEELIEMQIPDSILQPTTRQWHFEDDINYMENLNYWDKVREKEEEQTQHTLKNKIIQLPSVGLNMIDNDVSCENDSNDSVSICSEPDSAKHGENRVTEEEFDVQEGENDQFSFNARSKKVRPRHWTGQERTMLVEGVQKFGRDFEKIARFLRTRSAAAVKSQLDFLARKTRPCC
jgi:hypothetical protein